MKKLTKENRGIIFLAVGLLLILLGWFYYSKSYSKNVPNSNPFDINTNMSLEKGEDIHKNKIDAYKEEIKDSVANSKKKNDVNLDFDMDTNLENKDHKIQSKIDSILLKNKIDYTNTIAKPKKKHYTSSPAAPSKNTSRSDKSINEKKMNDFFNNQPPTKTKVSNNNPASDAFIYATINGDQTVYKNGRVEFRLSKDALIYGKVYRKNTFLYGTATFAPNRVYVSITNINHIPVDLKAYDSQDGNLGIYVDAESLSSETFNEATDVTVRDINVKGIPVGTAVKKIFRKKTKERKVRLLNNYKLILKTKS